MLIVMCAAAVDTIIMKIVAITAVVVSAVIAAAAAAVVVVVPERNYIHPLSPISGQKVPGEGGGGVYFEAPRGRNFIPPPPPPFIHRPTRRRVFSGVGGWGCIKFGRVVVVIPEVIVLRSAIGALLPCRNRNPETLRS